GASEPLPSDYPDGNNTLASVSSINNQLSAEDTAALLHDVPKVYHTEIIDILLTSLTVTLSQWTGSDSILINLEGHGREQIIEGLDVSRTVGWFTAIFPVRLKLKQGCNPGQAIKSIKEQLRQITKHGIVFGLLRYLTSDRDLATRV